MKRFLFIVAFLISLSYLYSCSPIKRTGWIGTLGGHKVEMKIDRYKNVTIYIKDTGFDADKAYIYYSGECEEDKNKDLVFVATREVMENGSYIALSSKRVTFTGKVSGNTMSIDLPDGNVQLIKSYY